jgi:hypothetical protein
MHGLFIFVAAELSSASPFCKTDGKRISTFPPRALTHKCFQLKLFERIERELTYPS